MHTYKIITRPDLNEQVLLSEEEVLAKVNNPETSIEAEILEELNKQTEQRPVLVGYDNTLVLPPGKGDMYPLVSMGHLLLADTLRHIPDVKDSGDKGRTMADLGCGSGFLGLFLANNFAGIIGRRILMGDLFPSSLNGVIRSYCLDKGLNLDDLDTEQTDQGMRLTTTSLDLLDLRVGDVAQTMVGEEADIAVACPIFIPGICEVFPQAYQLFGAVAKEMGADFYFAHSNLADKVIEEAAQVNGAHISAIKEKEFPYYPQRMDTASRSREDLHERIEELVELGLRKEDDGNMCHKLKVSKMSF